MENNKFIPKTYEQFILEEKQSTLEQQQKLYPDLVQEDIWEPRRGGPCIDSGGGGGYSSNDSGSSDIGICEASGCNRLISRSRRYCSEHIPGSTMTSAAKEKAKETANDFREMARKSGGYVLESDNLRDGGVSVHYFSKKKDKEPKKRTSGRLINGMFSDFSDWS